ncbi:MAG TPA: SRPBCC family protein, partial [Thermoanaerobaculia bacterium]|nr:SRPBCC family protein [Thermoanaerobaculia bacterium]
MIIRFHETFALPADEVFSYFQSPSDWIRLYGFGGGARDLGGGWFAVPLQSFPFPLVARMTAVEPSRLARWEFRGFWKGEAEVRFTPSDGGVTLEGFERISMRWLPLISSLLESLFLERAFRGIWGLGWKRLHRAERAARDPLARFSPGPPLPEFIASQLPQTRRTWRIESGADAGR